MKFGLANNKDSKKESTTGRDRDSRRDEPHPVSKYTAGSKDILAKRKKVCDPWRWSSHRSINKALSKRMRRFALVKLWVKLGLPSYHASKGVTVSRSPNSRLFVFWVAVVVTLLLLLLRGVGLLTVIPGWIFGLLCLLIWGGAIVNGLIETR
jgi:hypothetical protein